MSTETLYETKPHRYRKLSYLSITHDHSSGKAEKSGSESASSRGSGPPQANMEVCEGANIYKTGSDPEIKEDSAYPDWLWGIAEPPPSYTQLSPDTKRYWRRLNKTKAHERNLLEKQSAGR